MNNENYMTDEVNLFHAINSAKASLMSAITQIMEKSQLPSCVMDTVICDALSDIRKQEIFDMAAISRMEKEISKKVDETKNEIIKGKD